MQYRLLIEQNGVGYHSSIHDTLERALDKANTVYRQVAQRYHGAIKVQDLRQRVRRRFPAYGGVPEYSIERAGFKFWFHPTGASLVEQVKTGAVSMTDALLSMF